MKRRDVVSRIAGATVAMSTLSERGVAPEQSSAPRNPASGAAAYKECSLEARHIGNVLDPTYIDPRLDSRSVSFENLNGTRGGGGKVGNERKRHPFYILDPGEKVMLAEILGPGTLRHFWTMLSDLSPEIARALRLEVFYDGMSEPSISVPILDFFGLPHGRVAEYYCALISVNCGKGLNSHIPMPFRHSIRVVFTNESNQFVGLFYQIDYTLERDIPDETSYLHVSFRRQNPTILKQDFVIADALRGPGRFLGCSVGIRVIDDGPWYGEGEVKIYRDGDQQFPTYCGTGLEDYVGSAYGMERHYGPYGGVPLNIYSTADSAKAVNPAYVGFYRWHLPDPIMFSDELRVTIQQIGGSKDFKKGQEAAYAAYKAAHTPAGPGWITYSKPINGVLGFGLIERQDDYCATAFVYCREPQPVPRYRGDIAVGDVGLLPTEVKAKPDAGRMPEDEEKRFSAEFKEFWGSPLK